METLRIESTAPKLLAEILQRLPADWFRPIECNSPAAEVEFVDFFFANAAYAQVISKVGATAARRPIAADGLQPARRTLQECHRRHQCDRESRAERLENTPNQSHVVVRRQPEHGRT